MEIIRKSAKDNEALKKFAYDRADDQGGKAKLILWNKSGDDLLSLVGRTKRMVDCASQILDDEVYVYNTKISAKEPFVGGSWEWHQDYGYWYGNGCLYPRMLSVIIAIDPNTKENGCLQMIKGSHLMGRLQHEVRGEQLVAESERVAAIRERLETVYAELEPGDALFMHCNTLHFSEQNRSPHPRYYKLEIVPDDAILSRKDSAPSTANPTEFATFEEIDTDHGV